MIVVRAECDSGHQEYDASSYFEVLLSTYGYFEVLIGTLRCFLELLGTLKYF